MATFMRTLLRISSFRVLRRDWLLSQDVERQRVKILSREKGRYIDADLYYPPGQSPSSSAGKLPVLVNWHGSGFLFPLLRSDSLYCARIARDAGLYVLDADYRKAPENPFPGPLEDVEDVLKWVATQQQLFDPARVAVSGFSAGGNLALVAASALRKTLIDLTILVVVAIYPVTNLSIAPEAKTVPKPRKPIPAHMARFFNDCYVPDKALTTDPRVSPSLADPVEFPSTVVIITCDGDTLSPEGSALADKLDDGHRKVINRTLKDVHHGFDKGIEKGTNEWDQREEAYALVAKTLKEALAL